LLEWLAAFGAISGVAVVVRAVASFSPVKSYFSDRREYKKYGDKERDILKAIMTTRTGTLKRDDDAINQSISLVPMEDGAYVRNGYLDVARYRSALEYLVDEGCLRKGDGEDGIKHILTPSGQRFIEKFSKKLSSHQFVGSFSDGVHHAKMQRLNTQCIYGTVHMAMGTPPLGEVNDPYSSVIACIPPKEQKDGVIAIAYIIGKDLPVKEGDMVLVQFSEVPYHIRTFLSPRWTGTEFFQEGDTHVPTENFTVRNIHSREDRITEIGLSNGRLMNPVT